MRKYLLHILIISFVLILVPTAHVASHAGELEDAIESYKQAIRIDPDFALAHSNLGVATATSISYFLFYLVVFTTASNHIMEWRSTVRFHFEIMIFYIYFLMNILWIDAVVNFPNIIATTFLKITCFLLISIPVLIGVQRRERIFSLVFETVKSKNLSFKVSDGVVLK